MVAQQKPAIPAYIPFRTFEGAVTEALEQQGLPRKLDRSVFPKLSGSSQSGVLRAFEFLGFTDAEGVVQQRLKQWIADPGERQSVMRAIITERYAPIVALANSSGTPAQLREEIEKLGVSGSTIPKAIRFYIAASEFAGMPVPPTWKRRVDPADARKRRRRRTRDAAAPSEPEPRQLQQASQTDPANTVDLGAAGTVTLKTEINPMALAAEDRKWLFGLIDQFRARGSHGSSVDAASEEGDDDA